MSRRAHITVQIILLAAQLANALLPILSPDGKVIGLAFIGFLQGGVGIINHAFNTDGTPQTVAFQGDTK